MIGADQHAIAMQIIDEVATARGVTRADLTSRYRVKAMLDIKYQAIAHISAATNWSQRDIGAIFGVCHTTIGRALRRVNPTNPRRRLRWQDERLIMTMLAAGEVTGAKAAEILGVSPMAISRRCKAAGIVVKQARGAYCQFLSGLIKVAVAEGRIMPSRELERHLAKRRRTFRPGKKKRRSRFTDAGVQSSTFSRMA
jgi:hypothetical protein